MEEFDFLFNMQPAVAEDSQEERMSDDYQSSDDADVFESVIGNSFMEQSMDQSIESFTVTNSTDDIVPEDCTLDVEYVDGKKQGPATIKTKKGILYAKLNYEDDLLNGYCIFNDLYGKKRFEGYYENGLKDGWGCEYDENRNVIFFGFYKDGERYSELSCVEGMKDYYEESINGRRIAICQYNEYYQRDGICLLFEKEEINRISFFQQGLEMNILKDFNDGRMTEYDENETAIYEGDYEDNPMSFYPREGQGEEYEKGNLVYNGEWEKNQRNGNGDTYRNGYLYFSGYFKNGVPNGEGEMFNEDGDTRYSGYWNNGVLKVNEKVSIDFETGKPWKPAKPEKEEKSKQVEEKPNQEKESAVRRDRSNVRDVTPAGGSKSQELLLFAEAIQTLLVKKNQVRHVNRQHDIPVPMKKSSLPQQEKRVRTQKKYIPKNKDEKMEYYKKKAKTINHEREEQLKQNRKWIESGNTKKRPNNSDHKSGSRKPDFKQDNNHKQGHYHKSEQKRDYGNNKSDRNQDTRRESSRPDQKRDHSYKQDNYHKSDQKRDSNNHEQRNHSKHKPDQSRDNYHKSDQKRENNHKSDQSRDNYHKSDQKRDSNNHEQRNHSQHKSDQREFSNKSNYRKDFQHQSDQKRDSNNHEQRNHSQHKPDQKRDFNKTEQRKESQQKKDHKPEQKRNANKPDQKKESNQRNPSQNRSTTKSDRRETTNKPKTNNKNH